MKIFLISQTQNTGYDTFDSAVVVAEREEDARLTIPDNISGWPSTWGEDYSTWCKNPEDVTVTYLGEAKEGSLPGVVCASFNAG